MKIEFELTQQDLDILDYIAKRGRWTREEALKSLLYMRMSEFQKLETLKQGDAKT